MTSSDILLSSHLRVVRPWLAVLVLVAVAFPGTMSPGNAASERVRQHGIAHFCYRLQEQHLEGAESDRFWQRCLHSQKFRDGLAKEVQDRK